MKQIVSTAMNMYLMPRGGAGTIEEIEPHVEVVLTTAEQAYHSTHNSSRLASDIVNETVRFHASTEVLRQVAKQLVEFADETDALMKSLPAMKKSKQKSLPMEPAAKE